MGSSHITRLPSGLQTPRRGGRAQIYRSSASGPGTLPGLLPVCPVRGSGQLRLCLPSTHVWVLALRISIRGTALLPLLVWVVWVGLTWLQAWRDHLAPARQLVFSTLGRSHVFRGGLETHPSVGSGTCAGTLGKGSSLLNGSW